MKKYFRLEFEGDEIELHKKIKVMAVLQNESMKDFIIKAIQERIEKIEKQKLVGE